MKYASIIITLIAFGLIIFNITKINWMTPFSNESMVAFITIFTALCAIVLVQILRISKKIQQQKKTQ